MKKARVLVGLKVFMLCDDFCNGGIRRKEDPCGRRKTFYGYHRTGRSLTIWTYSPHTGAAGEWKQYSSLTSMVLDLNAGNVEYLLVPASVASYLKAQDDSLTIAPGGAGVPTEIRMAVRGGYVSFIRLQDGIQTLCGGRHAGQSIDTYNPIFRQAVLKAACREIKRMPTWWA